MTTTSSPPASKWSGSTRASPRANQQNRIGRKIVFDVQAMNLVCIGAADFQTVPREPDARRQFCLGFVVVIIVGEVREERPLGADAPGGGERFIKTHVR